jgi:DNA-binding IscR family transcriptional regulator
MLDAPNFRFEVIRQLIGADIDQAEPQSVEALVEKIGTSQFTLRKVLGKLFRHGIVNHSLYF